MGRSADLNFSGKTWAEMVNILGSYKSKIYYHIVQWKPPMMDQVKCNTDEASKGNLGESAIRMCFRDMNGDIIYAQAKRIGFATNIEAEVKAI
ncbi:hypothetical protein KY285_028841 [Solanum tuberosum]|nr:hypothetical protein KY284_028849 [Solanum tuberosum]KAH0667635.1 hypothetical protein KY285_028841 [Solanum tuberosum]KAH0689555.1 hypothetical protein KY289_016913 [Solanum tuberosum]